MIIINKDFIKFTEEEFEERYQEILENIKKVYKPVEKPYAQMTGGQPGAGKSIFFEYYNEKYNRNIVIINGDDFREYHPEFKEISKYPEKLIQNTSNFSNKIVERLISDLSKEKYNILIEGTLKNPDLTINTAKKLKSIGYNVELSIIATNAKESWNGTIDRAMMAIKMGITPRLTSKYDHDRVVKKISDSVKKIEDSQMFDKIEIYNRNLEQQSIKNKRPHEILQDIIESDKWLKDRKQEYIRDICMLIEKGEKTEAKLKIKKTEELFNNKEELQNIIKIYGLREDDDKITTKQEEPTRNYNEYTQKHEDINDPFER